MQTISIKIQGNKTIRITKDKKDYFKATITQSSDINEYGDVLDTKELKTLSGINRWLSANPLIN